MSSEGLLAVTEGVYNCIHLRTKDGSILVQPIGK